LVFHKLIAHDKGKPVAKQGRKAVSLETSRSSGCRKRS